MSEYTFENHNRYIYVTPAYYSGHSPSDDPAPETVEEVLIFLIAVVYAAYDMLLYPTFIRPIRALALAYKHVFRGEKITHPYVWSHL